MYVYHALGNALSAYLIPKKKKKKKKKKKRKKKARGRASLFCVSRLGPAVRRLQAVKQTGVDSRLLPLSFFISRGG